jgi:hypothetical protein
MDKRQRLGELKRQANDLLAGLAQPLQQLGALQGQIVLLEELLKEEQDAKAIPVPADSPG